MTLRPHGPRQGHRPGEPTRAAWLEVDRDGVLAHRRRAGALDERLPPGPLSLRQAAWAGLQDSSPRAALLSIHARVSGIGPSAWEDPSLVQLWGPRFAAYVVAARDLAVFSLGRLPVEARRREAAEELARRLDAFLAGRRMGYGDAARGLGESPNMLRYAAPTGTVLIRWDGAHGSEVRTGLRPDMDPLDARQELLRRYLHVLGPSTEQGFRWWAGVGPAESRSAFHMLAGSLAPVRTAAGEAWILAEDEASLRAPIAPAAPARLLPSGDAYFLLHGPDRRLLVPDAPHGRELWTGRVPPGALLVHGEVAGVWRRTGADVTIRAWRSLPRIERESVEREAVSLPLGPSARRGSVRWEA